MKRVLYLAALTLALGACEEKTDTPDGSFNNRDLVLQSDIMTPEVLWSFGRLSEVALSPDGSTVVYGVTYTNISENKSYTDLYTVPAKGGEVKQITNTKFNEAQPGWRPDGQKITFLSSESGSMQLWEMNIDGSARKQITDVEGGISAYLYSPDMKQLAYIKAVKLDQTVNDLYPDLPLANARIEDDLMYRHWDSWHDYTYNHLFIAPYSEGSLITSGKDIMEGERFDSPMKPFGGMEQIAWSPDSKSIVYTCKKLVGRDYAFSTNSDLYLYNIETGLTENLTEGMMGYDQNPVFSPDGSKLIWESMERDGYEADKNRLFLMDMASREKKDLTASFDHNIASPVWDREKPYIWFVSNVSATEQIHAIDLQTGEITKVTEGMQDFVQVLNAGDILIAVRMSISSPSEIY